MSKFKIPGLKGAIDRLDAMMAETGFSSGHPLLQDWVAVKFALKDYEKLKAKFSEFKQLCDQKPLPPEFAEVLQENFWDLLKAPDKTIKYEPIPDYGDLMTMEDFVESCKDFSFLDEDGTGYYATATQKSNKPINPSDVMGETYDKSFSHVVWFNK